MRIFPFAVLFFGYVGSASASPAETANNKSNVQPMRQFSISPMVWVPFRGTLQTRDISPSVVQTQIRYYRNRTPILNEIIRLVPHYFPPQARVLSVRETGPMQHNYFLINLNQAFANPKFWSQRKRRENRLAFHALARNVAFQNEPKGTALPVRFAIKGKIVPRIGSFNTSWWLKPEQIIKPSAPRQSTRN